MRLSLLALAQTLKNCCRTMVWHKKLDNKRRHIAWQLPSQKLKSSKVFPFWREANDNSDRTTTLESQLYSELRQFLLVSQVFICAPMGCHSPAKRRGLRNAILQLLHLSWCLSIYITLSICIYTEYTQSNVDLPTVQKPLYFCEYLVYLLHILHILVATYWGHGKYRCFIERILAFDRELQEFAVQPNYQLIRSFAWHHLHLIELHFVSTALCNYYYSGEELWPFFRSIIVFMIPNIILEVSLTQYYTLLYATALRAFNLNSVLHSQLSILNADEPNHVPNGKPSHGNLQRNMERLRLLYSTLELFTREVNSAFGISVVLVYLGSFMNLTVNIFLIYKYMDDWQNAHWAWIMYSVIWSFMHVGKMFLILYYNQAIQTEKNNTALLLNGLRVQNTTLEQTISHFVLQLVINTRSNVVCGVAILDMEFITSLLVAISTTFIFLLQYDITFEALKKTHISSLPIPAE